MADLSAREQADKAKAVWQAMEDRSAVRVA